MSDFAQRLRIELRDLSEKADKLKLFIGTESFNKLDAQQKELLNVQYLTMEKYVDILKERVELLGGPTQLTPGERAVRVAFNPSKFPQVDKIKQLAAALYDELYDQRNALTAGPAMADGEQIAQFTLALRKVEEASMRGVGAATYNL